MSWNAESHDLEEVPWDPDELAPPPDDEWAPPPPEHGSVPSYAEPAFAAAAAGAPAVDVEPRVIRAAPPRFATADESAVRLAALVRVMNSSDFRRLCERVESLPEYRQLNAEMTGIIRQIVGAQDALVTTQLRSLAIAFLLIFPCIYLGIRSWSLTILAMALNAIPVLAAFALMGIANIPLDAATVMVAGAVPMGTARAARMGRAANHADRRTCQS